MEKPVSILHLHIWFDNTAPLLEEMGLPHRRDCMQTVAVIRKANQEWQNRHRRLSTSTPLFCKEVIMEPAALALAQKAGTKGASFVHDGA